MQAAEVESSERAEQPGTAQSCVAGSARAAAGAAQSALAVDSAAVAAEETEG